MLLPNSIAYPNVYSSRVGYHEILQSASGRIATECTFSFSCVAPFFLSLIYILPYDAVLFAAAHRRNALAQSHFQATAMIMPRVADMDFSRISYAH